MKYTNVIGAAALAVLLAACGGATGAGVSPTQGEPLVVASSTAVSRVASVDVNPRYSCPTGYPDRFRVATSGYVATALFTPVKGVDSYQIELQRRLADLEAAAGTASDAAYQSVSILGIDPAETPLLRDYVLQAGIYRARIRVQSCGLTGSWSSWFEFSIGPSGSGGGDAITPGGGDDNGDDRDLPGGPGDGDGGGDDNDHSCHNGGNGDHNDDGHHDCGIGNNGHGPN